jgi:nitrogen fixation/metabolism regulation signal transduction histidine kinase
MTDLIDSLLEFARTRESLSPANANVSETILRSVQAVRLHPRHHNRSINVLCGSQVSGWFDARKLERALYNLLLNACEAAPGTEGHVEVTAAEVAGAITISVADNGPGLPWETLKGSLDYLVRVSDKSSYVSPTRGQLGNALKCIWAAAFVADGTRGRVDVSTGGMVLT